MDAPDIAANVCAKVPVGFEGPVTVTVSSVIFPPGGLEDEPLEPADKIVNLEEREYIRPCVELINMRK